MGDQRATGRPGRAVRALGAVTTGGILDYDEASDAFFLAPEHAALLTGPTGMGPIAVRVLPRRGPTPLEYVSAQRPAA